MPVTLAAVRLDTPVGKLMGFAHADALCALTFGGRPPGDLERRLGPVAVVEADPLDLRGRFAAYLAGDLSAFDGVKVDTGGTPFQQSVWAALRRIRPGSTLSYAELARVVGRPAAVRAVGSANGQNPVAIIVPCHRVVRSDGSLGGYGGGLDRKRWLLRHERALPPASAGKAAGQRSLFDA